MVKGSVQNTKNILIKVQKDGPYLVSGCLPLQKEIIEEDSRGYSVKWATGKKYKDQDNYALCRCGNSKSKPYCDGSHIKTGFDGTETATKEAYAKKAEKIIGPEIILTDVGELCFGAGFCHNKAGNVWELTEHSKDKDAKQLAIQEACNCPSGRLVVCDKKTSEPIEPNFKPSISLIEEPGKGVSGPIWVKGGVAIKSSEGTDYETRNRVTLCRCGNSKNKPFCDGHHTSMGFNDEE